MKPYLSLVIPYYNDRSETERLLKTIAASRRAPSFEAIVVDDASNEKLKIQDIRSKNGKQKFPTHIIRLEKNQGPAAARNRGAKAARGKFLVFLDSDVELFPDTLQTLAQVFQDDPDVVALTGVWVKEQRSSAFFPNFKALRDWSYWINERDKSGYYFLFSTRIAAIKRSVFLRLGGFDERYPGALVEDIELTYRIARRYAIIFAPNVRVRHEFESFWPIAKKYFLRAYYWSKLYAKRKKFDPVATTMQEAMTTVSGVGVILFAVTSLVSLPSLPLLLTVGNLAPAFFYQLSILYYLIFLLFGAVHIVLIRRFLVFMYQEKGLVFAVKGFFVGLLLYCFILAGVVWAKIR